MGWFKGQFIDIIQWEDKRRDHIVWRFERHNAEIKSGAKLIVNPGEAAIFVNKGKPEHVFYEPGTYELSTSNYPFLSTILGLPYGLESPHKAYVYFVSQALFMGMKWGTKGKIDFNDPDMGPVSLGAYGTYDFSVKKAEHFFEKIVASLPEFSTAAVSDQIRTIISSAVSTIIPKSQVPLMQIEENKDEFQKMLLGPIQEELDLYGLQIEKFIIADISFPPEIEEALGELRKANVEVMKMKKMKDVVGTYQQIAAADAMKAAAKNPGMAGGAMGMGAGFAMGNQMTNAMSPGMQPPAAASAAPPPLPAAGSYFVAIDGKQHGPYTPQQIQQYVAGNRISKSSLVWKQGMAQWIAAEQVPELARLFAPAGPPPLPPGGSAPPPPPPPIA